MSAMHKVHSTHISTNKIRADAPKSVSIQYSRGLSPTRDFKIMTESDIFHIRSLLKHGAVVGAINMLFKAQEEIIGYAIEIYWAKAKTHNSLYLEFGVLCLVCGKFHKFLQSELKFSYEIILKHIIKEHCVNSLNTDDGYTLRLGKKMIIESKSDYDCRLNFVDEMYDMGFYIAASDNFGFWNMFVEVNTRKYRNFDCLLCGKCYAVAPSSEIIISHLKKCDMLRAKEINENFKFEEMWKGDEWRLV